MVKKKPQTKISHIDSQNPESFSYNTKTAELKLITQSGEKITLKGARPGHLIINYNGFTQISINFCSEENLIIKR